MKNFTGTATKAGFETTVCSRCLGTGTYSFNLMHGNRCYGCGGSKMVLTKRGQAARKFMIDLQMKPASELQVGYSVWTDVVTPNGVGGAKFRKIVAVHENGYSTAMCRYAIDKDSLIRAVKDQAELDETINKALQYQESL